MFRKRLRLGGIIIEISLMLKKQQNRKRMKNKVINLFSKHQVVQNEGIKYSELLEKFMSPFVQDFADAEYREDIFDFAINAWNIANITMLIPEEGTENAIKSIQGEGFDINLLNRMVDYKISQFKTHTNFIIDYELKETSGDPILSVITQEEEAYLSNMFENIGDEQMEANFEEDYIDRTAIIVKPLQPFIDWLTNLYPDEVHDLSECNTYLIDENVEVKAWLRKKFDKLFMMELELWHTNKKEWPQKRNYKMFNQWFRVEISTMVYDLEKIPVSKFE